MYHKLFFLLFFWLSFETNWIILPPPAYNDFNETGYLLCFKEPSGASCGDRLLQSPDQSTYYFQYLLHILFSIAVSVSGFHLFNADALAPNRLSLFEYLAKRLMHKCLVITIANASTLQYWSRRSQKKPKFQQYILYCIFCLLIRSSR